MTVVHDFSSSRGNSDTNALAKVNELTGGKLPFEPIFMSVLVLVFLDHTITPSRQKMNFFILLLLYLKK